MARRCFECGKIISGSVVDHYRNCHYGTYLANGEEKIIRFADKFAPEGGTAEAKEIRIRKAQKEIQKKVKEASLEKSHDPRFRSNANMVRSLLDSKCDVQTYRAGKVFICDVCGRSRTTGKRILSIVLKYTVCYDCYNTIKKANPQKRGNKHFYINTPM